MTSPQFTSAPCTNCNGKKYNSRCFDEVGSDDFGGEGYAKRGQIENIPCPKCQKGESVKTTIREGRDYKNMKIPEYIFDHRRNAEIRRKQDPMQNRYCQDVDTLTDIIVEELKAKGELKEALISIQRYPCTGNNHCPHCEAFYD